MCTDVPANMAGPPPENATEWIDLFRVNPLVGMFYPGIADVIIMLLWVPVILALFVLLHPNNKTWTTMGVILMIIGVAVCLASNTSFSMLSLSHKYELAVTEEDKNTIIGAALSLIAVTGGTGGIYTGMPLVWYVMVGRNLLRVVRKNK